MNRRMHLDSKVKLVAILASDIKVSINGFQCAFPGQKIE
jgi:hypothetical protein